MCVIRRAKPARPCGKPAPRKALPLAAKRPRSAAAKSGRTDAAFVCRHDAGGNWLIVCAAGEVGAGTDSWFSLIDEACRQGRRSGFDVQPAARGNLGRQTLCCRVMARRGRLQGALSATTLQPRTSGLDHCRYPRQDRFRVLCPCHRQIWAGQRPWPVKLASNEDEAKRRGNQFSSAAGASAQHAERCRRTGRSRPASRENGGLSAETETLLAEAAALLAAVSLWRMLFGHDPLPRSNLSGDCPRHWVGGLCKAPSTV
jgi:hypothetical protein